MIDTHTHIDLISDDPFEQDQIVAEAVEAGIGLMINIGVDENRLSSCRSLAERNESVYFTAGFHPEVLNTPTEAQVNTNKQVPSLDILSVYLDHPLCLGIGEIGLDYFHNKENKAEQKQFFADQLDLAVEKNLPISIHTRDAWKDTFDVLEPYKGRLSGIFHCFTGTKDEARRCLDFGFFVSFAGMLTYKNAESIREAALLVPADRTFLETDAPFLAPIPMRGKPNRPAYVKHLYEFYAQLKGLNSEEIERIHKSMIRAVFKKLANTGRIL